MSPQCLARLGEFRRSMAIVGEPGTYPGAGLTRIYTRWYGGLLRHFLFVQGLEREMVEDVKEALERDDDVGFERRAFNQAEFDAFCEDPAKQALVADILASI